MIHKFSMNGFNIVLDVNSGAVHVVDNTAYKVLDYYDQKSLDEILELLEGQYSPSSIIESVEELDSLKQEGLLYSQDTYEQESKVTSPVIKALCLHVAHDCNMKCRYCFAKEGEYGGKRSLMSLDTGKHAVDFLIKNSKNRVNLELDFFGGEPLLNFEVVKGIVEYAKVQEKKFNKNFRFTLTTNGLLLNQENMNYINQEMHNVVLSIDGRKSVNDQMRCLLSGKGSYDAVMPKIIELLEKRNHKDYFVRGTYTKKNLDFSKDVLHLADLGFKYISLEPVVLDKSNDLAITEDDLPTIFKEYEYLAKTILELELKGKGFQFFHFNVDLTGGPCLTKRIAGCGVGKEYVAVTPEGDLYACHQFVGNQNFYMGQVTKGVVPFPQQDNLANNNVYSKENCKSCFSKFYCSGGCAANAFNSNNDISKAYEIGCKIQQKILECALMMNVYRACIK